MRLDRRALLLAASALPLAGAAFAHRAKQSITRVSWNGRTGALEVVHRLHAHDAELALGRAGMTNPALDGVEAKARLALMVEEQFALAEPAGGKPGAPLPLAIVGAEIDADEILVYQEQKRSGPPEALYVRNDLLRAAFPDQVNQVNLDFGAGTRTLVFRGADGWKQVALR
ncbi:MAG TPA: DUF6702 family protein [Azospirillaceae bacterium]|nr:DUF6702 family protein [Azospirillaceae bacterium]